MRKEQKVILVFTLLFSNIFLLSCKQSSEQIVGGSPRKGAQDATGACQINGQTIENGQQGNKTLFKPNVADCSEKTEVPCTCDLGILNCPTEATVTSQGFTQASCTPNETPDGDGPVIPPSTPGSGMSSHVLGLYDNAGEHLLSAGGADRGWVLVNRHLKSDRHTGGDAIAMDLISRGFGVITRLNWDYEGVGTIPAPGSQDETTMLSKMRDMVTQTPSAKVWIIGNEPNRKEESYSDQAIPPQAYALFFNKARSLIKGIAGHEHDIVMPAALAPASGDYNTAQYFRDMMQHIPALDAVAVHAKPDSSLNGFFLFHEGDAITTHNSVKGKLIFITEANPKNGWQDGTHDSWVSQAIQAVKSFNDRGEGKIAAMVVYRFEQGQRSEENIRGRLGIENDFKNAANMNVLWR